MQDVYRLIDQDPRFHALERRRSRFSWALSAMVLCAYYAFILVIAFEPSLLGRPLHESTVITLGMVAGLGVMLVSVTLTGVYVWRANREFDPANCDIVAAAMTRARAPATHAGESA